MPKYKDSPDWSDEDEECSYFQQEDTSVVKNNTSLSDVEYVENPVSYNYPTGNHSRSRAMVDTQDITPLSLAYPSFGGHTVPDSDASTQPSQRTDLSPKQPTSYPIRSPEVSNTAIYNGPRAPRFEDHPSTIALSSSHDPFALPKHSGRDLSSTPQRSLLSLQSSPLYPRFNSSLTPRRHSHSAVALPWYLSPSYSDNGTTRRVSVGADPLWIASPVGRHAGFIDTHCHLDMLYAKLGYRGTFGRFRDLHKGSFPAEFSGCITNFCNPRLMVEEALWEGLLAEDLVWGAFGCHPHFADEYSDVHERAILMAMRHPKAVAFGEIGLDYSHKNSTASSKQKEVA